MRCRWLLISILTICLVLSGCSGLFSFGDESGNVQKQTRIDPVDQLTGEWWKKPPEYYELKNVPQLTQTEKDLLRKEGPFSGKRYNFEQVKKKLNEIPQNATTKEIEEAILHLIHENYYQDIKQFLELDPNVDVSVQRPDEQIHVPAATKAHFSILLDASGSMNAKNREGTRMDEAKKAIQDFVKKLPGNSTVSLRVYGHIGTGSNKDKAKSCNATETIFKGAPDIQKLNQALSRIKPSGWTPIGKALAETKNDIPKDATTAIVYVVSDGIETCNGNPVAEAKKLSSQGIKPIINIIGFQVDNKAQQLLKKVAEAGNGTFTYAGSKQELDQYLAGEYDRLQKAWDQWQREGKKLTEQQEKQLKEKIEQLGASIKEKSNVEFKRAKEMINYLKETRGMEQADGVWFTLKNRSNTIWYYGHNKKNEYWWKAHNSGNKMWWKFHNEGNKKWWEYYHKKK